MKSIKTYLTAISLALICNATKAQNTQNTEGVSIKSNPSAPHSSAMLDVESSTKGILIPRVALQSTSNGSTPIANPAVGLLVFNTNATAPLVKGYYFWDGIWKSLATGNELWSKIGTTNDIYYSAGKVVVGSSATVPNYALEINKPTDSLALRSINTAGDFKHKTVPDNGWSPEGNVLQQVSKNMGGTYGPIIFEQRHGNGVAGLTLRTQHRPASDPIAWQGWSTIHSNNNLMYIGSVGGIVFIPHGRNGSNPAAWFDATTGQFINPSDSVLKTNVTNMPTVMSKIMDCRPVTFNWIEQGDGKLNYGFIAQEFKRIFPELVSEVSNPMGDSEHPNEPPHKTHGISYITLSAILLKAIQEQQAQINDLQSQITNLIER